MVDDPFDDIVEKWHSDPDTTLELHEYLGLTWDEYKQWAEKPTQYWEKKFPAHHTAYGVRLVSCGEEGEWLVALGHIEPRKMIAAANHFSRVFWGLSGLFDGFQTPSVDLLYSEVEHHMAYMDDNGCWWGNKAPGKRTVPVTALWML